MSTGPKVSDLDLFDPLVHRVEGSDVLNYVKPSLLTAGGLQSRIDQLYGSARPIVANGSDDGPNIQATIDELDGQYGASILMRGTYYSSIPLDFRRVSVLGANMESRRTTLIYTGASAPTQYLATARSTVEGMQFECGRNIRGIQVLGKYGPVVRNCRVFESALLAVFANDCSFGVIDTLVCTECQGKGVEAFQFNRGRLSSISINGGTFSTDAAIHIDLCDGIQATCLNVEGIVDGDTIQNALRISRSHTTTIRGFTSESNDFTNSPVIVLDAAPNNPLRLLDVSIVGGSGATAAVEATANSGFELHGFYGDSVTTPKIVRLNGGTHVEPRITSVNSNHAAADWVELTGGATITPRSQYPSNVPVLTEAQAPNSTLFEDGGQLKWKSSGGIISVVYP